MTLLEFCTEVADEIGVVAPSSIVNNSDLTARRLLACAKAEGQHQYRAHNWSVLHREFEFSTVADVDNYALPDDWGRPLGDTVWDRTAFRRVRGNLSSWQWQIQKGGLVQASTFNRRYRLVVGPLAGSILLDPVPGDVAEIVIEYVSRFWVEDAAGDGKADFTVDTDVVRLDHSVFRLGLLWRTRRTLGLDFGSERDEALMALGDAVKYDFNLPTVQIEPQRFGPLSSLPEGNFPDPANP